MPDRRQHRGPHPEDRLLFAGDQIPRLRAAAGDLAWLLSRNYAPNSALKLVGDRYKLTSRQRVAVSRCTCSDSQLRRRSEHQVSPEEARSEILLIDGYNVLTSLEAALSGGVILHARDRCYRDMASMHGSYRKVRETLPALEILGNVLSQWQIGSCHWLLDQPVSNSGRLASVLRELAEQKGWCWQVELAADPDAQLIDTDHVVVSADSHILDRAGRWLNLAKGAIDRFVPQAWIVDLSGT